MPLLLHLSLQLSHLLQASLHHPVIACVGFSFAAFHHQLGVEVSELLSLEG